VTDYSRRRSAVLSRLDAGGVEALLVSAPANVRYLCAFSGSNGWLLLARDEAVLVTDPRYEQQAADEAIDARVAVTANGLSTGVAELVRAADLRDVGFEPGHVTVALADKLRAQAGATWHPVDGSVEAVRRRKDAGEVEAIRTALGITEASLREAAAMVAPGRRESEVAADLEHACRRRGAEGMAFDTIVASGSRTALPHGVATDKVIERGDPVMIDIGCRRHGYCSDITRIVLCGEEPPGRWRELYDLVDAARAAALAALRAGTACAEVDAVARDVIAAAGYGEAFRHGTGHGVGLDIHEAPALSARSEDRLEAGMVVTVEPAVYLPGEFGIRIEDLALVTDTGCERLTALDTEPILRGIS
jgi:Xaa-Pro aminopeptidase